MHTEFSGKPGREGLCSVDLDHLVLSEIFYVPGIIQRKLT
jgi:hypothetical protein